MKFGMVTQTAPLTADRPLKFGILAAAILKITKIAISTQRFDRSLQEIWYADAKRVS